MRAILLLLCFLLTGHATAAGGAVSERIYKQLTRVHELMDEERYGQALERLKGMRPSKKRSYEQALVGQTFGYLYAAQEQYPQAIEAFAQSLALKALPESATRNTLYALAQLQVTEADYTAAIGSLEQWFKLEKTPPPQAHALAGMTYAQAKQYPQAIDHLQKAIASTGDRVETWYRQLLAVYSDAGDYQAAARLLAEMTKRFPERKTYWLQLSSVYRTLKNDAKSLAVLELAYQRGLLTDEQELVELIHYYLYMDMPHKAGKLLEQALQDGVVSSTGKHWRLLSDAWLRAKEMQRAIKALKRASELAQDAGLYLRLAQLASQIDGWSEALHAVDAALRIGGLEQPGNARILKGMAHYQRQEYSAAKASFEQAVDDEPVREQAQKWLDYLASETVLAESSPME